MILRNAFKKDRKEYITLKVAPKDVPEGILRKCKKCGTVVLAEEVKERGYICPKCGGYFRMHALRRIQSIADRGSFEEWFTGMETDNPLDFEGYTEKVEKLRLKTKLDEAVTTGKIEMDGIAVAVAVMDSRFLMASMGRVVGEKITRTIERATENNMPVIIFSCSGGARMQEGLVSLMQMAKTSAALKRHSASGNLYISVLTDPTTGGVTASFAMLGDIILAEPKALIGFAGPRVIEQTLGQKLPSGFQSAEFLLEHGFIDRIVPRNDMRDTLIKLLKMHVEAGTRQSSIENLKANALVETNIVHSSSGENQVEISAKMNADTNVGEMNAGTNVGKMNAGTNLSKMNAEKIATSDKNTADKENKLSQTWSGKSKELSIWDRVMLSRRIERPVGDDYINALFDQFIELHGDRYFGDDSAIMGGLAYYKGTAVTVIAQVKGRNTKENVKRNFGMPSPEGYRKALRLMKQAEKFSRPVICIVDTPGAFCGIGAEERGQGEAIARNLYEMSAIKTPIITIIVGEAGSGGALAMAVSDQVWMLENSVYSILSPEGYASILWKDSKKAAAAAKQMKMTAEEIQSAGIVEKVFKEPDNFTLDNLDLVVEQIKINLDKYIRDTKERSTEEMLEARYKRFRVM